MATSTIKGMTYLEDSHAATSSHPFYASVVRDGRAYLASISLTTTSDVGSFTSLCELKNVSLRYSQYVAGIVGNDTKMFYISTSGSVRPVGGIASGSEVKINIPLVLN